LALRESRDETDSPDTRLEEHRIAGNEGSVPESLARGNPLRE